MPMYSPGGQEIPSGLTGYGLQLWQSGYFDPPGAAPAAAPTAQASQPMMGIPQSMMQPAPAASMYSPGGQVIPSGLTGTGLQLWQSGYFDQPAAAPPPPPAANPFMYDLTPLGQSMNGGAAQVAAAPMAPPPPAPATAAPQADYLGQVNDLYQRYFGRQADNGADNVWVNLLKNGTVNTDYIDDQFQGQIKAGQAANALGTVNGLYQQFWGRDADNGADNPWVKALQSGGVSADDIRTAFQGQVSAAGGQQPAPAPAPAPSASPAYGGQYNFNTGQVLNGNSALGGWGDISQGVGANQGTNDYSQWLHFTGQDGTPLAAYREYAPGAYDQSAQQPTQGALTGYRVFSDPGDFGGTGFKGGTDSRMNGINYDHLDANGNYTDRGTFTGWTDSGIGDALGVGSILAMAGGAAAAGLGSAGAGAGAAGGTAGASTGAGLTGGGFVGEGAASGIGAWDAALAGAPAAGGAAAGAGLTGGGFVGEGAASGIPAWDTALATAPAATGATTGAGFVGEGASSGVPAWDSALANAVPAGAVPTGGGAATPDGVPPPANPNVTGSSGVPPPANPNVAGGAGSLIPGVSNGSLLGGAATALGGLAGSQTGAGTGSGGAGGTLDPRMEPYLYGSGGLLQQTQNTLNQQQPLAQAQSANMASVGTGLLNRPVAGNTAITLDSPTTATNPYLPQQADDIQRRTQEMLGQNNLATQSSFVGSGGLGGTRQGVQQGVAAGKAADYLSGNIANLYGTQYNNDQNRALQKYGYDQNYALGNRQQDLAGVQAGAGLLSGSQTQAFGPLTSASSIYKPYTGLASSAGDNSTNWQGVVGGLLGGAQLGKNMGWW